MSEVLRLIYEGTLTTDGSTVYIGGQDLGEMLTRCVPGGTAYKRPLMEYPEGVVLRVEVTTGESGGGTNGR